jgi:hypothetical protein
MQTFIVLGIVPGTDIQLTFNFWLCVAIMLALSPLLRALWHRRGIVQTYLVGLQLLRFIGQSQLLV